MRADLRVRKCSRNGPMPELLLRSVNLRFLLQSEYQRDSFKDDEQSRRRRIKA